MLRRRPQVSQNFSMSDRRARTLKSRKLNPIRNVRYNFGMSHTLDETRRIAFELPDGERFELANSLLDSVSSDCGLDEAWNEEAERRVEDLEAGTAVTYSWEEVETNLRARLAR